MSYWKFIIGKSRWLLSITIMLAITVIAVFIEGASVFVNLPALAILFTWSYLHWRQMKNGTNS